MEFLLISGIILILIVFLFVGFRLCYVEVPQNHALLLNGSKVVFSPVIVFPGTQKQFMPMSPVHIRTEYTGNNALLTQEQLLVDIGITYSLCVHAEPEAVLLVAQSVGVETASDKSAIAKHFSSTFKHVAHNVVKQFTYDILDKDQGKLRKALAKELETVIKGYCLEYININGVNLTPLTGLTEELATQQQEAKLKWDIYKKNLLEHRLEQAVSQQLSLSMEVKRLIDNYNKFIKKTIQDMLARRSSS